ncbi:hypothetical protein CNY89_26740, partial [Amaricoccus sp. HAR-UPW-R2A-40]
MLRRSQVIAVEIRQRLDKCLPKRLDRFFVGEVRNVLGQLEFRLIVASRTARAARARSTRASSISARTCG